MADEPPDLKDPASIVRLDAWRSDRVGQMLARGLAEEYDTDPDVDECASLEELDGNALLESYVARQSTYATTPFDVEGKIFRIFPGGLTIWSGFPGAGKTTLLRQFICQTLHRGSSVFLASLEEDTQNILVNLASVAAGSRLPTVHQMQWFIDAYGKRFKLWPRIGIAQHRQILAMVRKLAERGVRHAVIDSLMCLDVANDDFEGQRKFANLLAVTARATKVHIHLVAHPRKLISADQEPDINDVAGAREIGGIADNVIFVRRAKGEKSAGLTQTPMVIGIKKQRHGSGDLADICGWFHRPLRQFHAEQFPPGPTRYLPEDAYS